MLDLQYSSVLTYHFQHSHDPIHEASDTPSGTSKILTSLPCQTQRDRPEASSGHSVVLFGKPRKSACRIVVVRSQIPFLMRDPKSGRQSMCPFRKLTKRMKIVRLMDKLHSDCNEA